MPLIKVSMFPGRTDSQKTALIAEFTETFVRICDVRRDGVWVVIEEVPPEHWGVGGQPHGGRRRTSEAEDT